MKSLGHDVPPSQAVLGNDITANPGMTLFIQVRVTNEKGILLATPLPGGGSGDFANLKEVTGFLELPEGRSKFTKGEVMHYIPFR
jgi:molybdopterin molybdotransferase